MLRNWVGLGLAGIGFRARAGEGVLGDYSRLADNGHFFSFFLGGKLRISEPFYTNIQPTLILVSI